MTAGASSVPVPDAAASTGAVPGGVPVIAPLAETRPAATLRPDEQVHRINLIWLAKLRWGAALGQLFAIAFVSTFLQIALPVAVLYTIVVFEIISNVGMTAWLQRGGTVREGMLVLVLGVDVMLLTLLLHLTGGTSNPFTIMYLVHIALAAVVLRPSLAWCISVLTFLCLAALHAAHTWPVAEAAVGSHFDHMRIHLQGMAAAFVVAAIFIAYFVSRVSRTLAGREAELARARAIALRSEKLASLATLAAGAAHELSTPLSTIAVVAKELEHDLAGAAGADPAIADARLIREQVERCREVLHGMAADLGHQLGESYAVVAIPELLDEALVGLRRERFRVFVSADARARCCHTPVRAIAQALRTVLKNAQQATPPGLTVSVKVTADDAFGCEFLVRDLGPGMSPEVLSRAGEPFFTTKEPGEGMGLGLFLARAVLDRLGGTLKLSSAPGQGTEALIRIPCLTDPITGCGCPPRSISGGTSL